MKFKENNSEYTYNEIRSCKIHCRQLS